MPGRGSTTNPGNRRKSPEIARPRRLVQARISSDNSSDAEGADVCENIPTPVRSRDGKKLLIGIIIGIVIVLAVAVVVVYIKTTSGASHSNKRGTLAGGPAKAGPRTRNFEEVCTYYRGAVGVVVVTLEDSDGKLLEKIGTIETNCYHPIGTAFAIAGNKFATNCHVAYEIKDVKNGVVDSILRKVFVAEAKKRGVKTEEELMAFFRENQEAIARGRKFLQEKVRIRNVEIRLSHSDGECLPVTGVQIHPRYKVNSADFKNAEFDVAILTTSKNASTYFRIADTDELYELSQGQKIAYLGFPMEGILDAGSLNIEKPEATFKSGTINKITDFNNVHGDPRNNKSLIHDIPTVGGASGSPIFLDSGVVVAILWGANHNFDRDGERTASAAQHNFAVRIDSLDAVEEEKIHDIQDWIGEKI